MPSTTRPSGQQLGTDPARRHWMGVASAAGAVGTIAAAAPFVASMAPSERARALGAPVAIDIGSIKPGELLTVAWRGKPVWVLRRSTAMLDVLGGHGTTLLIGEDPMA